MFQPFDARRPHDPLNAKPHRLLPGFVRGLIELFDSPLKRLLRNGARRRPQRLIAAEGGPVKICFTVNGL